MKAETTLSGKANLNNPVISSKGAKTEKSKEHEISQDIVSQLGYAVVMSSRQVLVTGYTQGCPGSQGSWRGPSPSWPQRKQMLEEGSDLNPSTHSPLAQTGHVTSPCGEGLKKCMLAEEKPDMCGHLYPLLQA